MSFTPSLTLFVDKTSTPYYWLEVTLPVGENHKILSHGTVPEEANCDGEAHVDVNVDTPDNGAQTIEIIFGELDIDHEEGEIHVHLLDTSQTEVGGGVVITEDAQETTRPIDSVLGS